jgi:hypothetical protein
MIQNEEEPYGIQRGGQESHPSQSRTDDIAPSERQKKEGGIENNGVENERSPMGVSFVGFAPLLVLALHGVLLSLERMWGSVFLGVPWRVL